MVKKPMGHREPGTGNISWYSSTECVKYAQNCDCDQPSEAAW